MRTAVRLPDVAPGDFVWVRQQRWRVVRARRDADVLRLDLTGRRGETSLLAPFDRVHVERQRAVARLVRSRPAHALARLRRAIGGATHARSLPCLVGTDPSLAILPYQLEPALALANGTRRGLVADEVGLGKTLQALIVIADLTRREPDARVLVLVPASLCRQWSEELTRRFAIAHRIADRDGLDRAARDGAFGENVWRRSGVWLATLDFLKQPHVFQALPLVPWDLVVIDEAHDACGQSDRHRAADAIARRSRRLLLLTATPHSGDEERFRRLTQLGADRQRG